MATALRVLLPECAQYFWCMIARMNIILPDLFFSLGKVVMFSGI